MFEILGLELEDVTQTQEFLVADAEIEWDRPTDEAGLWFREDGMFVVFPMPPDEHRWRIFAEVTSYSASERPATSLESFDLSILLIIHDMNVVRDVCDRVAVMYLGEIEEIGPTADVFADP